MLKYLKKIKIESGKKMFNLKINSYNELRKVAESIRKNVVEMIYEAQSGHPRGFIINNRNTYSSIF